MTEVIQKQELDELEWRSPEWINIYGLRTENILEYFSLSPFWDRQCNNQVLKMQRQFQANSGGMGENGQPIMMIIPTFDAELRKLRGIEYVVHMIKEPDLWVIRKQRRIGDGSAAYNKSNMTTTMTQEAYLGGGPGLGVVDDIVVLADFFCVGSKVYMASNVHSILRQGVLSLSRALEGAADRLGHFTATSRAASSNATTATSGVEESQIQQSLGRVTTANSATPATQPANEESLFLLTVKGLRK
ncbi:Mediator of RNA polymerase II transcription subunit 6 [Pichia californica]|uniref:Mediator of RNA polymerase II transcription subunit 6 n=1 Tax=Pichia californica TaxID=460514 RepID=A0A9P7BHT0_9ASCO|nr:Mediator of RNA polymerase II transcription subunit 6 [[Candida] californica]KAG0690469.1 Mediator of RNA polymerase II transcription subunit 6 [[Candida] californica]